MQSQTGEINLIDAFERIPVKIYSNLDEGSLFAANEVAKLIREKQSRNEKCVLGLATGSTPKTMYAELVRMHKEEGLSFKNVISFNLDEYYPLDNDAWQSYNSYMHRNLFDHIDIDIFGKTTGDTRVPGPLADPASERSWRIDPRTVV